MSEHARKLAKGTALVGGLALVATAGVAVAVPSRLATSSVRACEASDHRLVLMSAHGRCPSHTASVVLDQRGPRGVQGPPGKQGPPGAPGALGHRGPAGPDVPSVTIGSSTGTPDQYGIFAQHLATAGFGRVDIECSTPANGNPASYVTIYLPDQGGYFVHGLVGTVGPDNQFDLQGITGGGQGFSSQFAAGVHDLAANYGQGTQAEIQGVYSNSSSSQSVDGDLVLSSSTEVDEMHFTAALSASQCTASASIVPTVVSNSTT